MRLSDLASPSLSYPEVGGSLAATPPRGYTHLELSRVVGQGDAAFIAAREAVLTFGLQRGLGLRPRATSPRAVVGTDVLGHLGPAAVPCRVVWAEESSRRAGFACGTLHGHPECGEEAFVVEHRGGEVVVSVRAFSRPASVVLRALGPGGPLMQRAAARRYLQVAARAARSAELPERG